MKRLFTLRRGLYAVGALIVLFGLLAVSFMPPFQYEDDGFGTLLVPKEHATIQLDDDTPVGFVTSRLVKLDAPKLRYDELEVTFTWRDREGRNHGDSKRYFRNVSRGEWVRASLSAGDLPRSCYQVTCRAEVTRISGRVRYDAAGGLTFNEKNFEVAGLVMKKGEAPR